MSEDTKTQENPNESTETTAETADKVEDKKFTQSELDSILRTRLDRELSKRIEVQKKVDELVKKVEQLEESNQEFDHKVRVASKDLNRYRVAYTVGLSNDGLELLHGETEEELIENANRIKRLESSKQVETTFTPKEYEKGEKVDDPFAVIAETVYNKVVSNN